MAQQYSEVDYWNDNDESKCNFKGGPSQNPGAHTLQQRCMGYGSIRHFLTPKCLMSSVNADADASDKSQSTNKVINGPFQSTAAVT